MDRINKELEQKKNDLNLAKDFENIKELNTTGLIALGEANIKKLDDLADLSSDELIEIIGKENLKKEQADKIIMDARQHWFKEEDDKKKIKK